MLAYDSLHPELKDRFVVSRANSGEFGVRFFEYDETQTSTMFAGTQPEGGSNFFVWISEWGVIQAEDLRRSEEILTGAIPSAKDGLVVVETTWRGGRGGHLWEIVKKALETPEEHKHPDDWRVVFFPWQHDPAYCDAEPQPLKEETVCYFSDKPRFSDGQKSWFQRTTSAAFLSSRMATKVQCRKCPASVHSTNATWQTSFGLTQRHCSIFSAVSDSPHREALFSGRFVKGSGQFAAS